MIACDGLTTTLSVLQQTLQDQVSKRCWYFLHCANTYRQSNQQRILVVVRSPMDRWGGEAGRGRGRGTPGATPPPARWGPPGPERHQHVDRWGGPVAPEAGRRDKWDKWTPLEGQTTSCFDCLNSIQADCHVALHLEHQLAACYGMYGCASSLICGAQIV